MYKLATEEAIQISDDEKLNIKGRQPKNQNEGNNLQISIRDPMYKFS